MRLYAAFDRHAGVDDGSILVVARTARRARSLAWKSRVLDNCEKYFDVASVLVDQDTCWPLVDPARRDKEHVIANVAYCVSCGMWGGGVDGEQRCGWCGQYPGLQLIEMYGKAA